MIQTDAFQSEQAINQTVVPNSKLKKSAPFIGSEGLMRAKGRSKQSELPFDQKHPISLPFNHIAVQLFVEQEHKANNHEGIEYVRSVIQQKNWVIGLKYLLQRNKLNCDLCRKRDIGIFQPQMADLPIERTLSHIYPFENTGVDYFGPLEMKLLRRSLKR